MEFVSRFRAHREDRLIRKKRILLGAIVAAAIVAIVYGFQKAQQGLRFNARYGNYNWHSDLRNVSLQPDQVALLETQKFIFTSNNYKQIFTPYTIGSTAVFVTSDSMLNTFHVMFEDSFLAAEGTQWKKLESALASLFTSLDEPMPTWNASATQQQNAKRRAKLVIGVALRLLTERPVDTEPSLATAIDAEAQIVEAANGRAKPVWLGPPDDGFAAIDYSQFRPVGSYARSLKLQRYFRAVKWLQSIPFRPEFDEELLAFAHILVASKAMGGFPRNNLIDMRSTFATADGPDWSGMYALGQDWSQDKTIAELRSHVLESLKQLPTTKVNDLVTAPGGAKDAVRQVGMRILSAGRLVDAEMFQRTTDHGRVRTGLPQGIEFSALLGSPYAKEWVKSHAPPAVGSIIETIGKEQQEASNAEFYPQYLGCLRTLLDDTKKGLPEFFRSPTWQQKTCNTLQASWAQMRHTLQLHVKVSVSYANGAPHPVGFVEPFPEFFTKLGALGLEVERLFPAEELKTDEQKLQRWEEDCEAFADRLDAVLAKPSKEWLAEFQECCEYLRYSDLWRQMLESYKDDRSVARQIKTLQHAAEFSGRFRDFAGRIAKGDIPDSVRKGILENEKQARLPKWKKFAETCNRLAQIANRQLADDYLSHDDEVFLLNYGTLIADLMGYEGDRYMTPDDDAPRIVAVFRDELSQQNLLAAVGRPREIVILYPYHGVEVLCRGAVMPYYEVARTDRPTNAEWVKILDSPSMPMPPQWAEPIYSPGAAKSTKANASDH